MSVEVIRVTQWHHEVGGNTPALAPGEVAYFIGDHHNWDVLRTPMGLELIERHRVTQTSHTETGNGWSLEARYDEWEVITADEWPDEVCAIMAERALLGEGDE